MTRGATGKNPPQSAETTPPVAADADAGAARHTYEGGFIADAGTEASISLWKAMRILQVNTEAAVERARATVRQVYDDQGVEYIESSHGTLPLQHRAAPEKVDWKSIALEGIAPAKLEKLKAKHTTYGEAQSVLSAPNGWSVEAKARPICVACAMTLIPAYTSIGLRCPEHG